MLKKILIFVFFIFLLSGPVFGQSEKEAYELFSNGKANFEDGKYKDALSSFGEALEIDTRLNNPERVAFELANIARSYEYIEEHHKAAYYFEESLKRFRELNAPLDVALILRDSALVYYGLCQYDKAFNYLYEAGSIYKRSNYRLGEAGVLYYLGEIYNDAGLYNEAAASLEEALNIYKEYYVPPSILIKTFNTLGITYCWLAQYEKPAFYFNQALKMSEQLDDSGSKSATLNNMGLFYDHIGQYDKAISCYRKALEGNKVNVTLLNNIGCAWRSLGQYDKALSSFEAALDLIKKSEISDDAPSILQNIGYVYFYQKRYKEAQEKFETAGDDIGLAEVYLATKRYNEAGLLLKKINPLEEDSDPRRVQSHADYGLALQGKGKLKEASEELLNSVLLAEEIRARIKERTGFFSAGMPRGYIWPYRSLVCVLAERTLNGEAKDPRFALYGKDLASSAFYFSEAAKARVLLEAMTDSARKFEALGIPVELAKQEESIINQLAAIENNWSNANKNGKEALKFLNKRKQSLKNQLESLIYLLRKEYPKYALLKYSRPVLPEEIPLKDNEVLLEYSVSEEATFLFKIRKKSIEQVIKIPKSKEELEDLTKQFCMPFNADPVTGNIPYQDFSCARGKALYDLLLSEALKDLPAGTDIIIVPDGILGLLPFEALVVDTGNKLENTLFASDKWGFTYYQSATVLALNRMLKPSKALRPIFALGNPVYNEDDPRYAAYKQRKPKVLLLAKDKNKSSYRALAINSEWGKAAQDALAPSIVYEALPETEEEVKCISRLFNIHPQPPDVLLGIEANETNLMKVDLGRYRYLHFATHADLPGKVQGIKEPFILLGQVENTPPDDGFLTLSKVLNLKLDADMVVLSACLTGRGQAMEGEGLLNFARAFQYAGARTVLVSLWEVASGPTTEYMEAFYRYLKEGKSKSQALALARKKMKQKYPNPFFWSAFIMHGEGLKIVN